MMVFFCVTLSYNYIFEIQNTLIFIYFTSQIDKSVKKQMEGASQFRGNFFYVTAPITRRCLKRLGKLFFRFKVSNFTGFPKYISWISDPGFLKFRGLVVDDAQFYCVFRLLRLNFRNDQTAYPEYLKGTMAFDKLPLVA